MPTKNYYIYDIRETLKQYTDDSDISNAHISFLIDSIRTLLLRQKYQRPGSIIPVSTKQRLHFDLEISDDNEFVSLDTILRTENILPSLIESRMFYLNTQIDGGGNTDIKFVYSPATRFPFVGSNKWLKNVVYWTIGQDYRLYFNAGSEMYKAINKVRIWSYFEDPKKAWESSADYDDSKNFDEDINYPMDFDIWTQMKDIIIKQLVTSLQIPQDKENNAEER